MTATLTDDIKDAMRVISRAEALRASATTKFSRVSRTCCEYAITDCHDTLRVGEYEYTHPYAQKLWAEIDAARERIRVLDNPRVRVCRV